MPSFLPGAAFQRRINIPSPPSRKACETGAMDFESYRDSAPKPVLHVEARIKTNGDGLIIRTELVNHLTLSVFKGHKTQTAKIRNEVMQWLVENFVVLSLGQEITSFGMAAAATEAVNGADGRTENFQGPHMQYMDIVLVTDCTGGNAESGAYWLQHVELDVQAYQLHTPFELDSSQTTDDMINTTEDPAKAKVVTLPCKELDGLWESYGLPRSSYSCACREQAWLY